MYYFEYDEQKSSSNQEKHGINFLESQKLWLDPDIVEIKANCEAELRYLVIGKIKKKYWSAIITYREENIRIISVRRSRIPEVKLYES